MKVLASFITPISLDNLLPHLISWLFDGKSDTPNSAQVLLCCTSIFCVSMNSISVAGLHKETLYSHSSFLTLKRITKSEN